MADCRPPSTKISKKENKINGNTIKPKSSGRSNLVNARLRKNLIAEKSETNTTELKKNNWCFCCMYSYCMEAEAGIEPA